jgi:hypothetical protein
LRKELQEAEDDLKAYDAEQVCFRRVAECNADECLEFEDLRSRFEACEADFGS